MMEKKIKEYKRIKIEACFKAFVCILLLFFSIYFTPNFVAKNFSSDGILRQITVFKINYIRLAFSILSTMGLLSSALNFIKPNSFYSLQLKIFNKQNATLFLILLFFGDLTFVVVHFISFYTPYLNFEIYSLFNDRAIPEIYQYIKWLWISILLIYVSKRKRSFNNATWALVFTYLLLDDALSIHEKVGAYFAKNFNFIPPLGLRLEDIGELAVTATIGIILLLLVAWVYLKGDQAFKKVSHEMLLLILALVFFGVGVDMVLIVLNLGGELDNILGVIEDGGEMLVASLIFWYVFILSTRDENSSSYIFYFNAFPQYKGTTPDRFSALL